MEQLHHKQWLHKAINIIDFLESCIILPSTFHVGLLSLFLLDLLICSHCLSTNCQVIVPPSCVHLLTAAFLSYCIRKACRVVFLARFYPLYPRYTPISIHSCQNQIHLTYIESECCFFFFQFIRCFFWRREILLRDK